MRKFFNVHNSVGLSDLMVGCAKGDIPSPLEDFVAPFESYGFPPALIPIWSESSGPNYYGLWKHWFVERTPTFVKMYVPSGREVSEIARTEDQLFCYITVRAICSFDGLVPIIEDFSRSVGIENLDEIDEVTLSTGDDPYGLVHLSQFEYKTPMSCLKDVSTYNGNFPSPKTLPGMAAISSFEVSADIVAATGESKWPVWFCRNEVVGSFYEAIRRGDFPSAWMSLNSSGWTAKDAKIAMKCLADESKDKEFRQFAAWWTSIADQSVSGY